MIMFASQPVADENVERDDQEGSDADREIENVEHAILPLAGRRRPMPARVTQLNSVKREPTRRLIAAAGFTPDYVVEMPLRIELSSAPLV